MNNLKRWVAEHKKASVIALTLLLLFFGGSVVSALNVAQHRAENAAQTTQPAQKEEETSPGDASPNSDLPEEEKTPLTDAQKETIASYDTDTESLISTLSASVWSASEGRYTLRFFDDSYVETVNGTPSVHRYAISRVDKSSDGYGGGLYSMVFDTDSGTHIVTYTDGKSAVTTDGKSASAISTLSSASMFALKNTAYERADAVADITVKGLNSEVTTLFGGEEKALVSALSSWCAVHYPSVTEATWQKVVNLDYQNNVLTTDFSLNDTNPVTVTCVYEQESGTFSFTN